MLNAFRSASAGRVLFVCACAAFPCSAAFAQDAPAAQDVALEESGPSLAERVTALEGRLPIDVSIYATTSYQTTSGASDDSDYFVGYLDLVGEGELWPGTTAVLEFESIGGDGPDADVPSTGALWSGWNGNAGSAQDSDGFDRVYLGEAFVSSDVLGHGWILDLGKIASTSYLDTLRVANDSTAQFLSGAFSNSLAFEAPWRGAGVALTYAGSERFDVRLLGMRPDNSGEDATHELFLGAQASAFWGHDRLPGNCSLYAWNNGDHDDQAGIGLNLDQDLNEHATAFARFGWQEQESSLPQATDSAYSFGCEVRGGLWGREQDNLGVALGTSTSHDGALDDETVFETYYKRVFNEHCEASLHLQNMQHPGGDPNENGVTALGLRLMLLL